MPSSVRSSARSSLRSSARGDMQSLGLEDEMSFGSDEDLMETIGEIDVPHVHLDDLIPPPSSFSQSSNKASHNSSSMRLRGLRSTSSLKSSSKRKDSSASLASTTHLLPPLPPVPSNSTLDLPADMFSERERPKRGSIMGAFKVKKSLRRWRDDQSTLSLVSDTSGHSTVSLHKVTSNASSSMPSFTSSLAQTPSTQASAAIPHIAPLSLPSMESVDRLSVGKHSIAESFEVTAVKKIEPITPSYIPAKLSLAHKTGAIWAPNEISHAILPGFPSTLASLEPITVITAQATKRPSSSTPGVGRGPHGFPQPTTSAGWTPCTIVFTLFKLSLSGDDAVVASVNGADEERTVAHVHVFSSQRPINNGSTSPAVRRAKSGFQYDPSAPRVEVERHILSRDSTASVCENYVDVDGRPLVLSIYFGNEDRTKAGDEWILEMKDDRQLREWVGQVKKTAIMINAEELGYGRAIRPVYEDTAVSADELALQLSVHARAVAEAREEQREIKRSQRSPDDESSSPQSQQDPRRQSLDALHGMAMSRSRSADAGEACASSLPKAHRKSTSETANGNVSDSADATPIPGNKLELLGTKDDQDPDSLGDHLKGLTLSGLEGLSFGGSPFAFPAPPSALPPPRAPRSVRVAAVPPLDLSDQSPVTSGSSSPTTASTPHFGIAMKDAPVGDDDTSKVSATSPPKLSKAMLCTPTFGTLHLEDDDDEEAVVICPPTPPRRGTSVNTTPRPSAVTTLLQKGAAPSIASTANSGTSGTSKLRRLRGKPQVIDVMAEFSAMEAELRPPEEDEEPIREDRERRIRFAEE